MTILKIAGLMLFLMGIFVLVLTFINAKKNRTFEGMKELRLIKSTGYIKEHREEKREDVYRSEVATAASHSRRMSRQAKNVLARIEREQAGIADSPEENGASGVEEITAAPRYASVEDESTGTLAKEAAGGESTDILAASKGESTDILGNAGSNEATDILDGVKKSEGTDILPQGGMKKSEKTDILPQGSAKKTEGTDILPQGSAKKSEGTDILPQGGMKKSEGTDILPEKKDVKQPLPTGEERSASEEKTEVTGAKERPHLVPINAGKPEKAETKPEAAGSALEQALHEKEIDFWQTAKELGWRGGTGILEKEAIEKGIREKEEHQ